MRFSTFYIQIDDISIAEAVDKTAFFLRDGKQHFIVTPNPEMVMMAKKDPSFRSVFDKADLSLIDGFGLKWGLRAFGLPINNRVPGADFVERLLNTPQPTKSYFILGGENNVAARFAGKYPNLQIAGSFEPTRGLYNNSTSGLQITNPEEHRELITLIKNSGANVLLVALGHGQQEKWLSQFLQYCPNISVGIGIGGTLDYLSGDVKRAPNFWRKLGLEWLWRLLRQPWRLHRIYSATISFSIEVVRWIISNRFKYRPLSVVCVLNEQDEILVVKNATFHDHWQLPQGGSENGESPEQTAARELQEETAIKNVSHLGSTGRIYKYRWKPSPMIPGRIQRHYGYKGQAACVVFFRFLGDNKEINVNRTEVDGWQWIPIHKLRDVVHLKRVELVNILDNELHKYVKIKN